MTKISSENDGVQLRLDAVENHDWPAMFMTSFECDGCEADVLVVDQHIVWQKPWHGGYWGEIFWTGSCCAEKLGAEHHSLGSPDEREE